MKQFLFSFSIISLLCVFPFVSAANGEEKDIQYYSDTSSDWRVFYTVEGNIHKDDTKYFTRHLLSIENEKKDIKDIMKVELIVNDNLILEGKPIIIASSTDPSLATLEVETFTSKKVQPTRYEQVKLVMYFKDKTETIFLN